MKQVMTSSTILVRVARPCTSMFMDGRATIANLSITGTSAIVPAKPLEEGEQE